MNDSITGIKRRLWLALLLVLLSINAEDFKGQRRRLPAPVRSTRIDYSKFLHTTKQHQESCNTCHKIPTMNWKKARGFPDVTDYPGHEACVRCHRAQFFKGAQPVICTNCHVRTSPREDARIAFRNPLQPRQFRIEFPHDKHQDVIAQFDTASPAIAQHSGRRSSFVAFAHRLQNRIVDYNNCSVCHETNTKTLPAPEQGWIDSFVPVAGAFKTLPVSHSSCFNCHWKNQPPTGRECGDCHKPNTDEVKGKMPVRISMKFRHEGGGDKQTHLAECTTCHINITKAASVRGLKPDVPITGCTECHNKSGLREDLGKELVELDRNKNFVCTYCHTSDVGRRDPPPGHYLVAERRPLKRSDIK